MLRNAGQSTTKADGRLGFGDTVKFAIYVYGQDIYIVPPQMVLKEIRASVRGKIKNIDAYIIGVEFDTGYVEIIKEKYGYPIRHIPLEWGSFNGLVSEIAISGSELTKT